MGILVKYTKTHPSGRVEYRRAFPVDLLPFIPGKEGLRWAEHKVSLGAPDSPGFHTRYDAAHTGYASIVAQAQKRRTGAYDPLDSPTIAYLAEAFRVESLQADEEARWDPSERELFRSVAADLAARGAEPRAPWASREGQRWAERARQTLEGTLAHYRRLRADGDLDGLLATWRDEAIDLAQARGLTINTDDAPGLLRLCRALNDAALAAGDAKVQRLNGEEVPTPSQPDRPGLANPESPNIAQVPLLSTFDAYAAEQGITPRVRREWRAYLEKLVTFLGHDDATQITADDVVSWKNHLLAEPTRAGRARSSVTVNDKYLTSLKATLGWAVEQRKLRQNVAQGIRARVPKKAQPRERSFTVEEARRILTATLQPASPRLDEAHRRARRWVPWLCAYSGARVGEMAQLRREDVVLVDGVWALRITPDAGTVKTKKYREVPLHDHVMAQGFLEVVAAIETGPLFYDPGKRRADGEVNRHIGKVGERLAAWVRKDVGIKDEFIKPNHAWRNTFKSIAVGAGILERVSDALTGHAPTSVGRRYEEPQWTAKVEAIRRIPPYPVDTTCGSEPVEKNRS